ncbi:hypothetical protein NPIL_667401, partial [Nephila pilipes]
GSPFALVHQNNASQKIKLKSSYSHKGSTVITNQTEEARASANGRKLAQIRAEEAAE